MAPVYLFFSIQFRQHLTLHWLNLQIEATHTQDGGFDRDQTCSLVFVRSVDLVLISRMLVLHLCMFRGDSTHEEADTRMFLHAIGGSKSINIVSSDTDVVVIGVAVFDDLNVDHLWITFGKGKDLRWILLLHSQTHSRPAMLSLPFPTNADTVSQPVNA
jgi:hypothetical protein